MKKIFAFMVTAILLLSLAACGSSPAQNSESISAPQPSSSQPESPSSSVSSQPTEPSSSETDSQPNESPISSSEAESSSLPESQPAQADTASSQPESQPENKAIVIYFSHTGNTKSVADAIISQTGADTFRLEPVEPYTTDYNTLLDVAQNEQRNNARPAFSGSPDNLDQYSVIYLGYPNWWGDMPMILYTFLDTYDLSGKTIAPFATSGGSGLSGTVGTIRSLEPNATVTEGLSVRDSAASAPDSAVTDWLNKIEVSK